MLRRRSAAALLALLLAGAAPASEVLVATDRELEISLRDAQPGQRISLVPGTYTASRFATGNHGLPDAPITVAPRLPGSVTIQAGANEIFNVRHSYWRFEGLILEGNARADHAIHIEGDADHFVLVDSTLNNFHAHVKVNGDPESGFPDFGQIDRSRFTNQSVRDTDLPVTPIDIVGGRSWHIKDNFIADFGKAGGNRISYGVFLKGNSSKGLIERNLVVCSRATAGGLRVGISLGGGGSAARNCEDKDCSTEHRNGVIRNNVVMNCSDAGIHLNRARASLIEFNTLLYTTGVDLNFETSDALVINNIVSGGIRTRKDARVDTGNNVTTGTAYGMWLPAIADRLVLRISDYDLKYPSLFEAHDVQIWQGRIRTLFNYLAGFDWGLGLDAQRGMFPDGLMGALKPAFEWRDKLIQDGARAGIEVDFWGRPRSRERQVIGAIDYFVSPCDLLPRFEGSDWDGLPPCFSAGN